MPALYQNVGPLVPMRRQLGPDDGATRQRQGHGVVMTMLLGVILGGRLNEISLGMALQRRVQEMTAIETTVGEAKVKVGESGQGNAMTSAAHDDNPGQDLAPGHHIIVEGEIILEERGDVPVNVR